MPAPRTRLRPLILFLLIAGLGLLPILPILLHGSPVLANDMLWAYYSYFSDFHRNWSWSHPFVLWSSSYQCGMPMHAYWQSGFLYPVTWVLFGPLPPSLGIHLFYAFHFSLAIAAFQDLGPRLGLHRPASLLAGIVFGYSGTMLGRYEHPTFLAGWAWLPLVLACFLRFRDRPGAKSLGLYAGAVALQAFGGHPQASIAAALLVAAFTLHSVLRAPREGVRRSVGPARFRGAATLGGGHLLALLLCAPLVLPFLDLLDATDRYGGVTWTRGSGAEAPASEKLRAGVFGFEEFSTGAVRPVHFLSLASPRALGSPHDASWWGGELWGEVFLYAGGLGLLFAFSASWKRAGPDMRFLWLTGLGGLWLAFGPHLGASQILHHIPVLNNLRIPARFLILFMLPLAALSAHGFQRWLGRPRGGPGAALFLAGAAGALLLLALGRLPALQALLLDAVEAVKPLDPLKDYAAKTARLVGNWSVDAALLSLSGAAVWLCARGQAARLFPGRRGHLGRLVLLFAVLLADLLRVHWDHFYRFPRDFYRNPPATLAALDLPASPFWRVDSRIEYRGLEFWRMHNDPLSSLDLLEREKTALAYGIHAVFGLRHVSAYLPMLWKWEAGTAAEDKSARYLLTNAELPAEPAGLRPLGTFGEVRAYERRGWKPRVEALRKRPPAAAAEGDPAMAAKRLGACKPLYSGWDGVCVRQVHDGRLLVEGAFAHGDTLLFRERAYPGWAYRLDRGPWREPVETRGHFLAAPLPGKASKVEFAYRPLGFYQTAAFAFIGYGAVLLAVFWGQRGRIRP